MSLKDCAKRAEIENLAPHDLRRTCARLCRDAGGDLDQIQSCSATSRFRRPRNTSAVGNAFKTQSTTGSALSRTSESRRLLWFQRTAPLGLALLSPPMLIIVLFHIFLGKDAGPWIAIALIHAILLWQFRSAFTPLWSFSPKAPGEGFRQMDASVTRP
jgi:hypothetical protein